MAARVRHADPGGWPGLDSVRPVARLQLLVRQQATGREEGRYSLSRVSSMSATISRSAESPRSDSYQRLPLGEALRVLRIGRHREKHVLKLGGPFDPCAAVATVPQQHYRGRCGAAVGCSMSGGERRARSAIDHSERDSGGTRQPGDVGDREGRIGAPVLGNDDNRQPFGCRADTLDEVGWHRRNGLCLQPQLPLSRHAGQE